MPDKYPVVDLNRLQLPKVSPRAATLGIAALACSLARSARCTKSSPRKSVW